MNSVESESNEPANPRSLVRFILPEGVLLAVSSAMAYAVAFIYETGYADYFGYPYWLIEVSWINVLLAWGALLASVHILLVLAFLFGKAIPASAAGMLTSVFARLFGVVLILGAAGWFMMSVRDDYWFGLFSFLFAGGFLALMVLQVLRNHRTTPREGTRLASWTTAVRRFGASTPTPDTSLARTLLNYKIFGRTVNMLVAGFVIASVLAIVPAKMLGQFLAESESDFLVTHQVFEWVAVRKYGDRVLAMRLYPKAMTLTSQYVMFPVSDPARVWSLRHLERLRVSAWQGRERR